MSDPLRILSREDKPIVEAILKSASMVGETMLQDGADLDWFFDNGFFMLDKDGEGVFWFRVLDENTMETHCTFAPGSRGFHAKRAAREGMRKVFSEIQLDRFVTKCKLTDQKVRIFSEWIGFRPIGNTDKVILECTIDSFILKDKELANLAFDADFPMPVDCSDTQACYIGFMLLCMSKGTLMRGIQVYNRMAILLEWEPLILVSDSPILIRMGDRQFSPRRCNAEV